MVSDVDVVITFWGTPRSEDCVPSPIIEKSFVSVFRCNIAYYMLITASNSEKSVVILCRFQNKLGVHALFGPRNYKERSIVVKTPGTR